MVLDFVLGKVYMLGCTKLRLTYDNMNSKITDMIDKVYEFWYIDCIHESAAACISLHRTKKGAEMAMEFHKAEKLKEWEKECKEYSPAKEYPFDFDQWWGVNECELLP